MQRPFSEGQVEVSDKEVSDAIFESGSGWQANDKWTQLLREREE